MSEYTAVNEICRPRARSGYKIEGGRIIGTGEPELIALDAVHEDESGGVRIELRISPRIHAAFCQISKAQGRSVRATLTRYVNQTALFLLKKSNEQGGAE